MILLFFFSFYTGPLLPKLLSMAFEAATICLGGTEMEDNSNSHETENCTMHHPSETATILSIGCSSHVVVVYVCVRVCVCVKFHPFHQTPHPISSTWKNPSSSKTLPEGYLLCDSLPKKSCPFVLQENAIIARNI